MSKKPEIKNVERLGFDTVQVSVKQDDDTIKYFSPYPAEGSYISVSEDPKGFLAEDFKASHPDIPVIEIMIFL